MGFYPGSGTNPSALTKAAISLVQNDPTKAGFMGTNILQIFKTLQVADANMPTFSVASYTKRPGGVKRAEDGTYPRERAATGTFAYTCEEYGLEGLVDDVTAKIYDDYFDAEAETAKRTLFKILMEEEIRIAAIVEATATFSNAAAATVWSTHATATPLSDVATAIKTGHLATGFLPNAMSLTRELYHNLCQCAQIRDRVVYNLVPGGYKGELPIPVVASALNLEYLFVGKAIYDSAAEGVAASLAEIWDRTKAFVFYHQPDAAGQDLMTPAVGRTMLWTKDCPENEVVETYRDDKARGNVVRVRQFTDEVVLNASLGYIITGCL